MASPTADRIVLALMHNPQGLTVKELMLVLDISRSAVVSALPTARKRAQEIGGVIPRSVHPLYRYRLVDKDNPNIPVYKAAAKVDIKDMVTRLERIHLDAATMKQVIPGQTRDGKLIRVISKQVGRACEDIAEAMAGL